MPIYIAQAITYFIFIRYCVLIIIILIIFLHTRNYNYSHSYRQYVVGFILQSLDSGFFSQEIRRFFLFLEYSDRNHLFSACMLSFFSICIIPFSEFRILIHLVVSVVYSVTYASNSTFFPKSLSS